MVGLNKKTSRHHSGGKPQVVNAHEQLAINYKMILSKVAPSINIILAILGLYVVFYSLVIGFCKFIVWLSAL